MNKVAWSAGHGINTQGKSSPSGEKEWSFNNVVVKIWNGFSCKL